MNKIYKESDVSELLVALSRKSEQVLTVVQTIEKEATKNSLALYDDFVHRTTDFETLAILVEARMTNLDITANNAQEMQDQFDGLKIAVAHAQIKASMKFFYVLSASVKLPLGSRFLFSSELKRLYTLRTELTNSKYNGKLSEETLEDLETAELILREIIEKAPSLLNFTDA